MARLDVQPIQVLVEAVIVSVELNREQEFGVNFPPWTTWRDPRGRSAMARSLPQFGLHPGQAPDRPRGRRRGPAAAAGRINGGTAHRGVQFRDERIKFGFVSKNNSGFIRALEAIGDTRVLASPRLLVLNKQKAEIQFGQRLGYSTVTRTSRARSRIQFLMGARGSGPSIVGTAWSAWRLILQRSRGRSGPGGFPAPRAEAAANVMIPLAATAAIGGLIEQRTSRLRMLIGVHKSPVRSSA